MTGEVHASKFYVPEPPLQYISDFGERSNTPEALLMRLLLHSDASAPPAPAIVVKGAGGTGKTTSLMGVGNEPQICARFPDAVWFVSLGRDAKPSALLENLETVVRGVVGASQAEEIGRLSKITDKTSASAEAFRLLNDRAVLLLLDDVWADEQVHVVGQSTVFSLVQNCVRRVQRHTGLLRVVISTRDAGVAKLVPARCRVTSEPLKDGDASAREMLLRYAEVSFNEIKSAPAQVQTSFDRVLDRCRGLQLALAIAGRGVLEIIDSGATLKDNAWSMYATQLAKMETFLRTSHPDHPPIYAMLRSSLEHVKICLEKDGVLFPDDLTSLFSRLGVVKKQKAAPFSVVECILGLSKEETLRLCFHLERLHMVSITEEDGIHWLFVHDVILEFCVIVLSETLGRKSFAHRITAEGLEEKLLGAGITGVDWEGCVPLWKLREVDVEIPARDYCVRSITRHMIEAGGEYIQQALHLVTDYRWVETHLDLSAKGSDLSGIVLDTQTLLLGCGDEINDEVKRGLELIADAARLSMPRVASNPRELAYQLAGRLNVYAGLNGVVDRFLWSLEMHARRPWLKAGKGVLKAAGGCVVLSATLSKPLVCVAVLPNGEDVIIGGDDGYLSLYSIRYACLLSELFGHYGAVECVTVCVATNRILSGGADGIIRAWEIGAGPQKCEGDEVFRHDRVVYSLAVTRDGSRVVFGDSDGWLVVCDSASGDVTLRWRGHSAAVSSLEIRGEDEIIISGSWDGTIAQWDPLRGAALSGVEVESRIAIGSGKVNSVAVSHDGKKIAYASDEKVGVLDSGSGAVLRECKTDVRAYCAIFDSDDETIHFGGVGGGTAALGTDGNMKCNVKAHSTIVGGMAQTSESRLLISVSFDCTLSVQDIHRRESPLVVDSEEHRELEEFVVLPDRKRVLYGWRRGPRGLKLLNVSTTSSEIVLSEHGLVNASTSVSSEDLRIWAIAASRDGRWVIAGTEEGQLLVYNTDSWHPRYTSLRSLRGSVWTVAISADGTLFAAGSGRGDVAVFRVEDGREMHLPSSVELDGQVFEVAFSEDSSLLLALVRNDAHATGTLHVWTHLKQASIEHFMLPCDRISKWQQPLYPTSVIASTSHMITRYNTDSEGCAYDFASDRYYSVSTEEDDDSALLQISSREHRALEQEGALFMEPFGREIKYCSGSGSDVLGTLEALIYRSFRPEQWTFVADTSIFVAGGYGSRLVSAILMEDEVPHRIRLEAPKLPPVRKLASLHVNGDPGAKAALDREFKVFISHAGPDKADVAIPLYQKLQAKGIRSFLDLEELRVGEDAPEEMQQAMENASIGVFILSPEFAGRRWPLKELHCFLKRARRAKIHSGQAPAVIPVFYRLGVRGCQSDSLYSHKSETGRIIFQQGFFNGRRQQELPTGMAEEAMREVTKYTGIENTEGAVNDVSCVQGVLENRMRRDQLLDRVTDEVATALQRQEELKERQNTWCVIA